MKEQFNKPKEIYIVETDFKFKLTSDEAYEILKNPKGKVAKNMRKYLTEFLNEVARKCLKYEKEEKKKLEENN